MICADVQKLIDYALKKGLITSDDIYVVRNRLMEALGLSDWCECEADSSNESIDEILLPLVDFACETGLIMDTVNSRDLFDTKLMGILTPMPREVIGEFRKRYENSPEEATDWYFKFSQDLNYVRAGRIAKDLKWTYESEYGVLDITINCSKPEKDPRDIAAAKTQKSVSYPKCQLCAENAGFAGTSTHPARQNLSPIPVTVNNEPWFIQYSPYGYYNEHCIVFNSQHVPMAIDAQVFGKLFDIIDYMPHYFVGSNADLPIVGGSILSHEHFQGGKYTFAMETSPVETEFKIPAYPNVSAGIVKWPMSVIRVSSANRNSLEKCCADILAKWRNYTDADAGIFAETDGVPHNTITPIARMNEGIFECDLVLRNNIASQSRPLGVFHPNPELHHIKKENIGLIEVMGLAVLPARLSKEIPLMERALIERTDVSDNEELRSHAKWLGELSEKYPDINADNARGIIEQEIGKVFLNVLEDAGVYKRDEAGMAAFLHFIASL